MILGPTAVGKSAIGLDLARMVPSEIVSADSMQVYRHMDIGTAKPSVAERNIVRHHLIDVADPDASFSVAAYQSMALEAIRGIEDRGLLPVLLGGTGLYIRAVTDLYRFETMETGQDIRSDLGERAAREGSRALHTDLSRLDPETAQRLHPNDARRIIRALEVYYRTGKPISEHRRMRKDEQPFDLVMVGLTMERGDLYQRIESRVDRMMREGLLQEVQRLLAMGYGPNLYSMQALGYKEMVSHVQGDLSLDEAVRLLKRNTRHFAKRQMTWFRRDARIQWIIMGEHKKGAVVVEDIASRVAGLQRNT